MNVYDQSPRKSRLYLLAMSRAMGGGDFMADTWEWVEKIADGEKVGPKPLGNWWVSSDYPSRTAEIQRGAEEHYCPGLSRNIFGPDIPRPAVSSEALMMARHIYEKGLFGDLPILADMMEDLGADQRILDHLREPGPHFKGWWSLDLILGKE